ncbi:MAG: hypothetical protein P8X96_00625 [Desulfobacteraceae bacterium]
MDDALFLVMELPLSTANAFTPLLRIFLATIGFIFFERRPGSAMAPCVGVTMTAAGMTCLHLRTQNSRSWDDYLKNSAIS